MNREIELQVKRSSRCFLISSLHIADLPSLCQVKLNGDKKLKVHIRNVIVLGCQADMQCDAVLTMGWSKAKASDYKIILPAF